MLASIFSLNVLQTALELGCIYALVALALFLSYSILNIADLSTDGCFTLGCAVACQVALTGHPILALVAAMAAGVCSGFVTAFLQTRLGVESIMAGIIVNTGLYTINPVSYTHLSVREILLLPGQLIQILGVTGQTVLCLLYTSATSTLPLAREWTGRLCSRARPLPP